MENFKILQHDFICISAIHTFRTAIINNNKSYVHMSMTFMSSNWSEHSLKLSHSLEVDFGSAHRLTLFVNKTTMGMEYFHPLITRREVIGIRIMISSLAGRQ